MATPKGMKQANRKLGNGDYVHVYSNREQIVLQLRRQRPTEEDLLDPSFKVAVSLSPTDALLIASDLLAAAATNSLEDHSKNHHCSLRSFLVQTARITNTNNYRIWKDEEHHEITTHDSLSRPGCALVNRKKMLHNPSFAIWLNYCEDRCKHLRSF